MSIETNLPLNLYKANLGLYLRIGKLLQESNLSWQEVRTRLVTDGVAETEAEIAQLDGIADWQSLATLPGEAFWRQLQQRFDDVQAASNLAIEVQTTFTGGLQDTIKSWQKDTGSALGLATDATPFSSAWNDLLKSWNPLLPFGKPADETGKKEVKGGK